jgi:hypothetical protein
LAAEEAETLVVEPLLSAVFLLLAEGLVDRKETVLLERKAHVEVVHSPQMGPEAGAAVVVWVELLYREAIITVLAMEEEELLAARALVNF